MIIGQIDLSSLDSVSRFQTSQDSEGNAKLVGPGTEIRFNDSKFQLAHRDDAILLLAGHPAPREARLAQQIKQEGWGCLLPWLLARPEEILNQVAGRFSLLWLDTASRQLGLASDRFNTHGFCYHIEGTRLSLSDRADQVPVSKDLSPQALFNYLYFHVIPAPDTVFRNIRRLEPAGLLCGNRDGITVRHWWSPRFEEPKDADAKSLGESFRTLVRESVRREAAGEARIGAFLSGGTDSSTVVGMLAQESSTPVQAYSIGFEAEGYDEMEYARITAKHYGAEHHEYYITPDDLLTGIPLVAAHYDQPFGNSSAVPAYYCAKLARADGVTRMLAGDGGDELFGGNTRYAKQRVFEHYGRIPSPLRRGLIEPLLSQGWMRSLPLASKAASYMEQARTPLPDRTERYNLLHRLGMTNVFEPEFLAQIDSEAPMVLQRTVWNAIEGKSLINRQLGFDWRFTLADTDLPKVIGSTQLAGVEVAFPLLDDDLVDFSARLPPRFKLKGQQLRWFFKDALRNFLPPEILTKPKHGFGLPFGPWTLKHDGLRAQASDALRSLATRGIVRPGFLDELMQRRLAEHPGYYGEMVWICEMLEHWLRQHAPDYRAQS